MEIRPATIDDVPALVEMEMGILAQVGHPPKEIYKTALTNARTAQILSGHGKRVIVALHEDGLAGYAEYECDGQESGLIHEIYCGIQRKGFGRSMVSFIANTAEFTGKKYLLVDADNGVMEFYRKCGFTGPADADEMFMARMQLVL